MRRFLPIDGLRAISVTLVIFFHAFFLNLAKLDEPGFSALVSSVPLLMDWVWHGEKGVDVFFVISGFLICTLLLKEQEKRGTISLRAFYIKRIFRIVPAYALLIAVGVIAGWPNHENAGWNLLFINNHVSVGSAFLPWAWSIAVEMQFYLLFPLVFLLCSASVKKLGIVVGGLLVAVLLGRLVLLLRLPELYQVPFFEVIFAAPVLRAQWFDLFYLDLWARSVPILLGILAALAYHGREQWFNQNERVVSGMALLGLALVVAVSYVPAFNAASWYGEHFSTLFNFVYLVFSRPLFSLGVVLVMLASLVQTGKKNRVHQFLSSDWLQPMAKASYSMYLFHIPLLIWITGLLKRITGNEVNWLLCFHAGWITVVFSLLLGLAIQRWVEQPGIGYSHQLVKRLK